MDAQLGGYAIALGEDPRLRPLFSRWHEKDFDTYDEKTRDTPRDSHPWHVDRIIGRLRK